MSRRLSMIAALLILALTPPSIADAAPGCRITIGGAGCGGEIVTPVPGDPEDGGPPVEAPNPELLGRTLSWGTGPDGEVCAAWSWQAFPTMEEAQEATRLAQQEYFRYVETRRIAPDACPGSEAPAITPDMIAIAYWERFDFPVPDPEIAPGWAITGMPAYLEAGSDQSVAFTVPDTPFGELTMDITSTYTVDWGDGTVTGPHDNPGAPWPDGAITHTYTDIGTITVTVTQAWTARWTLGGGSGTFDGVTTTGSLPAFEVTEVQAIRQR